MRVFLFFCGGLLAGLLCCFLLLVACGPPPKEPLPPTPIETENPSYAVRRLFTAEGCTVYRFTDADKFRYFTRCSADGTETLQGDECHRSTTMQGGKFLTVTSTEVCEDSGSIPTEQGPSHE